MVNGYVGGMGLLVTRRHAKTTDVSFFDGHAENMGLQKLWTLEWNSKWITPKPLPLVKQ